MKKRIICLILTVVMLSLSLASCGFSFVEDDLSAYATFDKDGFAAAIKALSVEDGDFTADPETRAKKVIDKIYSALAGVATETDKTEGVIGAHDILFYCYYMTCEVDGKTVQLAPDNMKTAKALKVQLGSQFPSTLEESILDLVANYDFGDKDNDFINVSSGKVKVGDVAFITYTYKYDTTVDGVTKTISDTVSLQKVVLDENDPLHNKLLFKITEATEEGAEDKKDELNIGTTISDFDIEGGYTIAGEQVNEKITISKAKVEYVVKGEALSPIVDTTYTEEKEIKDIYGDVVKLKDVAITYYVYPVKYTAVDELTAENILSLIYGKNLTAAIFGNINFGPDFSAKTEDEQKEASKDFVVTENEKTISFADFTTSIVDAMKKYSDAKTTLDNEKTNLEKAQDTLATKKAEASKSDLTEDEKKEADKAVADAEAAVTKQQISVNTAQTEFDKAEKERDIKVATALTKDADFAKALIDLRIDAEAKKEALEAAEAARDAAKEIADKEDATEEQKAALTAAETKVTEAETAYNTAKASLDEKEAEYATKSEALQKTLTKGYEDLIYSDLQATYRTTVEQNVAKAVYELINSDKYVKITKIPEEVADDIFDQLYENYEYAFYSDERLESDTVTTRNPGFYNTYNGSLKKFIVGYAVPTDIGEKVENYDQAIEAMKKHAEKAVEPLLRMYVVAKAYDLVFTDDDLEEYKDNNKDYYTSGEYYYGVETVRNALQLNKLMNYFIDADEKTDETDKRFKWDEYKNVTVTEYKKAED